MRPNYPLIKYFLKHPSETGTGGRRFGERGGRALTKEIGEVVNW